MRATAVVTTTMPPVPPARWRGRGRRGHAAALAGQPSRGSHADTTGIPAAWPRTTGQAFGFGAEGDSGGDPVDDRPSPAAALRRTPRDRRCAAGRGTCRVRTTATAPGSRVESALASPEMRCRKCGAGTARGGRRAASIRGRPGCRRQRRSPLDPPRSSAHRSSKRSKYRRSNMPSLSENMAADRTSPSAVAAITASFR